MREKMRTHLGSKDRAVFNIKHDFGGIVDIEFLVQFGVLSGAQASERLVEWTDVVRILDALTAAGFIDSATTGFLKEAYCLYREQAHRAALQEMPALLDSGRYGDMRHRVQRIWQDVMLR
jgi:glutamate-ammonia-ligase adenylyltransferase